VVYEEVCGSCGRPAVVKECGIRGINVCVECCLICNKRSECDLRVWFKPLKVGVRKRKGRSLEDFL
jgi:hypothetical protein